MLSNLAHRPIRTLLSVLAIAVEVTMILTLVGVSYGTLDGTARRARGVGADIMVRPPGSSIISLSSAPMSDRLIPLLAKEANVTIVTGTVVQPLEGLDTITGLDLDQFSKMSGGFHFLEGGAFQKDNDVLIDEFYSREKRLHAGDTVHLVGHDWHVAGVFESGKLARMCVRLSVLQQITGNPNRLSQIYIKVDDPSHIQTVVGRLRKTLPGYPIYTMEEFTSLLSINSVGLLRNFIGVVIAIAVVVGFIVVSMAMYTAVLERTREIGILRSLGASSSMIFSLLLKETLVLALAGTCTGIALTYLAQWSLEHIGHSGLTQETVYVWWPIAGVIAVTGAVLGTIAPALKAIRQEVTEALSYE
ncbi:FtsX-like permease family protein [Granulicella sp. dw_53]|uniref:ABC transporter permease n=1 Tax=Granulicella sp. dw_53 TaxID=2719792 RepID=UPI0031F69CA2